ncbi:MAG: hypothetical protein R3E46_14695 [Sedimenticolaceae bacterium]
MYWVPTIGTRAQVLFGYRAMARIVSLMPEQTRAIQLAAVLENVHGQADARQHIAGTTAGTAGPLNAEA